MLSFQSWGAQDFDGSASDFKWIRCAGCFVGLVLIGFPFRLSRHFDVRNEEGGLIAAHNVCGALLEPFRIWRVIVSVVHFWIFICMPTIEPLLQSKRLFCLATLIFSFRGPGSVVLVKKILCKIIFQLFFETVEVGDDSLLKTFLSLKQFKFHEGLLPIGFRTRAHDYLS